jgi:hypothetical protein
MRMRSLGLALAMVFVACSTASALDPLHMDNATFDREVAQRFPSAPPAPAPQELSDPRAGQAADAAYFTQYPAYERAFTPAERTHAQQLANQLRDDAASLTHEQFVLRVAEIAALADNGHTSIGRNAFAKNTPRIPIRTYLFADGLYVVLANDAHADLLGARIDRIDGRTADDIYHVIRRYRGGLDAMARRQLIPMLESPALLHAAGVARGDDALTLSGVLLNGQPFEQRIDAEQRDRAAWVSDTARLIFPDNLPDVGMHSLLHASPDTPLYLHSRTHVFAMEPIGADGFYFDLQFNRDADEGPIAPVLEQALTHLRADHLRFFVLDMRMNGGGDYTTTYAFAHEVPRAFAGHIYILTSPWTFSAAITTVAALKQAGGNRVTIVGEPVGDRLDFWAEGGTFTLPNSFLTVGFTNGRHVYNGPCRDLVQCYWVNYRFPVFVHTLAPDISAPLTFAAYRQNRDPAMDAVLAREVRSGSNARTR